MYISLEKLKEVGKQSAMIKSHFCCKWWGQRNNQQRFFTGWWDSGIFFVCQLLVYANSTVINILLFCNVTTLRVNFSRCTGLHSLSAPILNDTVLMLDTFFCKGESLIKCVVQTAVSGRPRIRQDVQTQRPGVVSCLTKLSISRQSKFTQIPETVSGTGNEQSNQSN